MPSSHKHYVLLAEDDYAFRWALAIDLERNGFDLDVAENGAEAIELMEKSGRHCSLIVDLRMPRLNGAELIARATTLRPDLAIVTVTAYPDEAAEIPSAARLTILRKPIPVETVREAVVAACHVSARSS